MTPEEINAKASELSKSLGKPVLPLLFTIPVTGEQVIGYMQEPSRQAKIAAMAKMGTTEGKFDAGDILLRVSLIEEESDPRFLSEKSENDAIYFAGCIATLSWIEVYANELKKN